MVVSSFSHSLQLCKMQTELKNWQLNYVKTINGLNFSRHIGHSKASQHKPAFTHSLARAYTGGKDHHTR